MILDIIVKNDRFSDVINAKKLVKLNPLLVSSVILSNKNTRPNNKINYFFPFSPIIKFGFSTLYNFVICIYAQVRSIAFEFFYDLLD